MCVFSFCPNSSTTLINRDSFVSEEGKVIYKDWVDKFSVKVLKQSLIVVKMDVNTPRTEQKKVKSFSPIIDGKKSQDKGSKRFSLSCPCGVT